MKSYNIFQLLGRDGFLKMRDMIEEHGADMFKRGGHRTRSKTPPNNPGTRGNQLQRMVKREQRYQQGLANIGLTLSWPRKHKAKPHRRRSENQYRSSAARWSR